MVDFPSFRVYTSYRINVSCYVYSKSQVIFSLGEQFIIKKNTHKSCMITFLPKTFAAAIY